MPLLHYLDYYIDLSRSMDIEEVSAAGLASEFKPLVLSGLPAVEGVTWLRFTIAPLPPEARPGAFLLDMGESIPGTPSLFDPERNQLSGALEWQEKTPAARNIILLPEEGPQAITCYIRIDGLPGPWFAPMIRTPQNAASNMSSLSRNAAILALAIVFVICILRGLGERGQWRIWTGLFVAAALVQAFLGMPAVSEKFSFVSLAAVLAPGVALMLLPHVGRHLLQTPANSRSLDIQLFLLSFPGAVIALWPLVPGWSWLDRWVDIWPIFTLMFVPTALGAWIMGIGGAKRFLTACLIPPLFTGFALAGLDFGFPANILSSAPVWGIVICALLIAATRSPLIPEGKKKRRIARPSGKDDAGEIISLDHPLDDPNLRLLPGASGEENPSVREIPEPAKVDYINEDPEKVKSLEERENALRAPLEDILRLGAALGQCSLPPAVRQYAENMLSAANMLADVLGGSPRKSPAARKFPERETSFSLQKVLRNVHDAVASFAESAGTALSWYVPPKTGRYYRGNAAELEETLYLLLESAVRATKNGSVHLSARRTPGSDDPGYILFSITDNGSGTPPKDRSSLAISRAWELIGRHGGYLAMEAGPDGVDIALSLRFAVEDEEESPPAQSENHILLASDDTARMREFAQVIERLPCRVSQLGSAQEVIVCQSADPASLLIAHGQLARPSSADTIRKFSELAKEAGFEKSFVLAITPDDKQWHLLKLSGFTHAMQEPNNLDTLKETVSALLGILMEAKPPLEDQPNPQETGAPLEPDAEADAAKPGLIISEAPPRETPSDAPQVTEAADAKTGLPRPETFSRAEDEKKEEGGFEGPEWLNPPEPAEEKNKEENEGGGKDSSGPSYSSMMDHVSGDEKSLELEPESAPVQNNEDGDPVVAALIRQLDSAMAEANSAYGDRDSARVAEATGRIISECEKVGLRLLARMASCVERAARENDMSALSDLLPELGLAVERNRVALNENLRGGRHD